MVTPVFWKWRKAVKTTAMREFGFDLIATDGAARMGRIETAHGIIDTPAFMPVGTSGTVKATTPEMVAETGAQVILGNTYHLMLRPGVGRVERFGGLHTFMNWPGPILTDSGGFQVMSLTKLRKLTENGVEFRSHIDGAKQLLTPERSIEFQQRLGADITMVLDECTQFPATEKQAYESMRLSVRWAERSKATFVPRPGHGLFGIVQGSIYPELRAESAGLLREIGFDGYAIGGLSVGEGQTAMFGVVQETAPRLPEDRPRYLMGVGKPDDLVGSVERGIDMFDCVLPTRSGRTDQAFTRMGQLNMRNARHRDDPRPLDPGCRCYACAGFSRGYIHHLLAAKEVLGIMLLSWHNLTYYQDLMRDMREAIYAGGLDVFKAQFVATQEAGDLAPV